MLKKNALKRIFLATVALFIVLVIYTIKEVNKSTVIFDDAYYINNGEKEIVYALNKDNYISKTEVYVDNKLSTEEKVKLLLEILTTDSNKSILLPNYFKTILPKNTKVLDVKIDKNILKVTFSRELLNITEENSEKMLEAIIYTLSELDDITGIEIYVENELLKYIPNTKKKLPAILTKDLGINKAYDLNNTNNINKVAIYYVSGETDNYYYIPITRYLNDKREKIEIIVDYLSNKFIYENNLKSFFSDRVKLLDYEIDKNNIKLIFNEHLLEQNNINEQVLNSLVYSVFDNYSADKIEILVNNNKILEKTRKDIE